MSAIAEAGLAGLLARADGQGPEAWAPARAAAAALLRAEGLPTRRVEAWKYTDLAPLAAAAFAPRGSSAEPAPPAPRAERRVVVADGVVRDAAGFARNRAAIPAPAATIAALNALLAEDGVLFDLEGDAGVVELLSLVSAGVSAHPRHRIRLGAGASLTLIESCRAGAGALHNPVFDIALGPGARLTHARIVEDDPAAFHLAAIHADVAEGATYDAFTLHLGGRIARVEKHVVLAGTGASAHLNGAQLVSGPRVADITIALEHAAPGCASRQVVKTVLGAGARGVFQGRILVRPAAQKTDGYQMNQALLLAPDSEMDSKPQLEIYADDVKCSHGATVGALDPDALFFLRSRGIPEPEARQMLVDAFLREAVETIAEGPARAAVMAALEAARAA
ncbi:MAG: Fe-S cluster assembly protein SufD [Acetobacteraceae bacterium]|nr:Fe-S cluster assembly protein SufD [Acetobacteraceae bacterium]